MRLIQEAAVPSKMETKRAPPTKKTIEDAFQAKSTAKGYRTYQKQFFDFLAEFKDNLDPKLATSNDCTDFFHHIYGKGRTARTVDSAKTSLVAYFKEHRVSPNPAQDSQAKQYVVGLKKYNKQHNIDEEVKAHPVSVHELSVIMNSLAQNHLLIGSMYRFMFSCAFLGCFRMGEVLALTWDDIALKTDEKGSYVSVRLRWHKKANVEQDCQIYHLVDENAFPCLKICGIFLDYLNHVKKLGHNTTSGAFVFPSVSFSSTGIIINWFKKIDNGVVRNQLKEIVQNTAELNIGISLHSMRRGGAFYRVFQSPHRKFNFRELMAWCRWEDAKTCCEYLITRNISDGIDPRNLLRMQMLCSVGVVAEERRQNGITGTLDIRDICRNVIAEINSTAIKPKLLVKKQATLDAFVSQNTIPTATSAREAWMQWFAPAPELGLFQSIQSFNKSLKKKNTKKYSERQTLGLAFEKYSSYEAFEAAYSGNTKTYTAILKEVRKRKRNDCM